MAEIWYSILMSISGALILGGILLTWLIRRKIESLTESRTGSTVFLIIGGLMTALGFAWGVLSGQEMNGWMLLLILIGPAFIGYALFEMGFRGVSGRLLIQTTLVLLSLLLAGRYASVSMDIAYAGPFLAILLLINSQIIATRGTKRNILITSSWIITAFSWERYLLNSTSGFLKFLIVLPHFLSVLMWVYVLASLYTSVSAGHLPLLENAQEGL